MLKDTDKEEKALDALISVTLLNSSRDPAKRDRIIAEIEAIREEDVELSRNDEIALERIGKSLFQESDLSTYTCSSPTESMVVSEFDNTVYAMGRNGEDANLDEETKKEIEERRKRILDELNNEDKKDEKTEE